MRPGQKLWSIFVEVAKVLTEQDLENFGRALFFGTKYNNLGRGARRTVAALALKIGDTTSPARVYVALASEAWGYGDLKQIAKGLEEGWLFRQLSTRNQNRILKAGSIIVWPGPVPVGPPPAIKVPPVIVYPPKTDEETSRGVDGLVALATVVILVGLSAVLL